MTNFISDLFSSILTANGIPSIELFIFLVIFAFGFLACIQNYRQGAMVFLLLSIGEFILIELLNMDTTLSIIGIVLGILVMAFTIFISRNNDQGVFA